MALNPTLSASDAVAIEVTTQMQPTNNGYIRLDTVNLAKPSRWNVTTQKTVEIGG